MQKNSIDYSTHEGARELARLIENYWRSQGGYEVWVEPVQITHRSVITGQEITLTSWGLWSDLVNGHPSRPPHVLPDRSQGLPTRQAKNSASPKPKQVRRKKTPVVIGQPAEAARPRTAGEAETEILELPLGAYPLGGGIA